MNFKFKSPLLIALCVSVSVAFTSCGSHSSDSADAEKKIGGAEVVAVNAGSIKFAGAGVSGTGSVAFKSPVGEIKSKKDYALEFSLEEKSSLKLTASANEKLENGFELSFTRSGKTLQISAVAEGKAVDISGAGKLASIDASKSIKLFIDVHNDESPAHILIWSQDSADLSEKNASYNSEDAGDAFKSPGNGAATFWGLVLSNASVLNAQITAPKFVEK